MPEQWRAPYYLNPDVAHTEAERDMYAKAMRAEREAVPSPKVVVTIRLKAATFTVALIIGLLIAMAALA